MKKQENPLNSFSIMKKKGSLKWKVIWPSLGALVSGYYAVTRVLDYLKGTDEDITGVVITVIIGLLFVSAMVWQIYDWLRTGKRLVTFTDTEIIFPKERIPVRRIKKLSVGWEQITVTKANQRTADLDLSLYTAGISREELSAIESWVKERGIANYYGPNDKDREMADLEAEIPREETGADSRDPDETKYYNNKALHPVSDSEACTRTHYGWKIWLITFWSILAVIGLLIILVNIPGEIRLAYFFKYSRTARSLDLKKVEPGTIIKVEGSVESEQSFTSAWDKHQVVYEHQTYVANYRGKTSTIKTLIHKAVPFRIKTDLGERLRVQPGVKPGERDIFEVRITGDKGRYTDWSIRAGERVRVYGPVHQEAGALVMCGELGKRLIISNLPERRLDPVNRFEFWLFLIAGICFGSGVLSLGISIGYYYFKLRSA